MRITKFIFNALTITALTFCSQESTAQIFDDSQPHFRTKWSQINTPNFRLIFPNEFKVSAPSLAHNIDQFLDLSSKSLKHSPQKINILIQQNHIIQNGFVQLAPRKSELFSTPSGVADNQQWLPNLALHEIQHIAQFDKLTGKIKRPFGELLALGFFGINLPSWYYEGDAVLHETLYSDGGRGRLSSWHMELRANLLSDKDYSFNKYIHGSFKDLVPSYYTIGYFMNSKMHEKDPEITPKIYADMKGKLLRPFNFQRALKKIYGAKSSIIFKETVASLKENWTTNQSKNHNAPITFNDKYPTHYYLPQVVDTKIYALKKGQQHVSSIVKFDKNSPHKTEKIVATGAQLMPYFDIKDNLITWDEYRKDPRFSKQTYNVINIYNLTTNTKKTLTHNTRYYTPALSPNSKEIACVEVDLSNKTSLIFLDSDNGQIIDSINFPANIHIQQPQYHSSGNKIIAIAVSEEGTNLIEIDRKTKQTILLFEWFNLQFERPVYAGNTIVFKVNQHQKDDIFQYNNGRIVQITDSKFGAFNPFVYNQEVWYNDYTPYGFKINKSTLTPLDSFHHPLIPAQTLYSRQNNFQKPTIDTVNNTPYSIAPYNSLKNSINFHSLTLSDNDFESFDNYKPGIYWLSNDILNTTRLRLGYEREVELGKNTYLAEATFQKYYPKWTVAYKNTGKLGWARTQPLSKDSIRFDYREHQIITDIQLPFSIYRGDKVYSYGFNFGTYYIKRYDLSLANIRSFVDEIRFPLNYQVYFNKNKMTAPMDLAPRWGQNFNITYRHLPFMEGNHKSLALRSNFYFPGFALSHSIQLRLSIQDAKGNFTYNYDIPLPNGYAYLPRNVVRNTLLFDYRLPLWYPDLSIGQFAYLKRIHSKFSFDYLNIHESTIAPKTISGLINFDLNLFKYNEPLFTLGFSATYINDSKVNEKIIPSFKIGYTY